MTISSATSTSSTTNTSAKVRVAVIGAGPSGVAALLAFKSAMDKDVNIKEENFELVCFDKQGDWGGMWNYTDLTGLDEYGEPVHTSMYRQLFINVPKELSELAEYTFDEHFGNGKPTPLPSYLPRPVLWDYLQGCWKKANVRRWCRFRTAVRLVQYDAVQESFHVTVHNLEQDRVYTETFDYVIVATSPYAAPNLVFFEGHETFPGRYMHSHDYRNAKHYRGQDLLLVGSSDSAEDIALQCWKYGAKSVTLSYRTEPLDWEWPEGIDERPLVSKIDGKTVHFLDGTCKDFDTVILCTGFRYHMPFLTDDLRLPQISTALLIPQLYKNVVWKDNPKLFYLGMADGYYSFSALCGGAWYVRDVILGRILPLPASKEVMEQEERVLLEREASMDPESELDFILLEGDMVKDLLSKTDCPPIDIEAYNRGLQKWLDDKDEDILTYRDQCFASLYTGTMACKPPTLWEDWRDEDDSVEAYLLRCSNRKRSKTEAEEDSSSCKNSKNEVEEDSDIEESN